MEQSNDRPSVSSQFFMHQIDDFSESIADSHKKTFFDAWRGVFTTLSQHIPFEKLRDYAIPITKESMRDLQFRYSASPLEIQDDRWAETIMQETQEAEDYVVLVDKKGDLMIVDGEYIYDTYGDLAHKQQERQDVYVNEQRLVPYLPLWLERVTQSQYFGQDITHEKKQELRSMLVDKKLEQNILHTMEDLLENNSKEQLLHDKFLVKAKTLQLNDYVVSYEAQHDTTLYEVVEVGTKTVTLDAHQGNGRVVLNKNHALLRVHKEFIVATMKNMSL